MVYKVYLSPSMLSELLQDRAQRYVSGDMTAPERENFELVLVFHHELRAQVAGLQEAVTAVVMSQVAPVAPPPAALKARMLRAVDQLPRREEPEGFVVTDPRGLVEWVNPAFTAMCGYAFEEIKGRKPGQLLQGPGTDPASVARIREALREKRPCHETLVNYHKDGTLYRVDVRITPILDDDRQPLWFVAQERKLPADEVLAS
jgi:PAS domain S-box-containing protein